METTKELINELEMTFGSSFKYTSQIKYEVTFKNSDIENIKANLNELHLKLKNNLGNDKHVGFQITISDVEKLINILDELISRYQKHKKFLPKKLYTLTQNLRELEEITTKTFQLVSTKKKKTGFSEDEIIELSKQRALRALIKSQKKMK